MQLKVCGMTATENIEHVAALQPNYMGFIFYEKSKRNFEGIIPNLPKTIKKTGVFVNEAIDIVISLIEEYKLDAVQLHGDESVDYIIQLKHEVTKRRALFIEENKSIKKNKHKHKLPNYKLEIIKVFGIKDTFNFNLLEPYLNVVDYFLFDTKGKERGGNGIKFNWSVLKDYPFTTPYFLSGGIGPEDHPAIADFFKEKAATYCYALDINSKFETQPGLKNIAQLTYFKTNIYHEE